MRQSQRIVLNTLSSWGRVFASAAVAFFLMRFLLRELGKEGFGVLRYVLAVQGTLVFLDLGLSSTLNRFVSRSMAEGDVEKPNAVVSLALFSHLGLGVLAGVIGAGMGFVLPSLVTGAKEATYASGMLLMFCMGGALAFRFWGYAAQGLLFALQRYDLVNLVRAGGVIVTAGAVFLLFKILECGGMVAVGLCYLGGAVVETLLLWILAKWQFPGLRIKRKLVSGALVREIFAFSILVLIVTATSILMLNLPVFFAGRFFGPEAVAYIALPILLLIQIEKVSGGFTGTLTPVAGKYGAGGHRELVRELFLRATKFSAILCIPAGVVAIVFARPLLDWFEEGFGRMWVLFAILAVPFLLRATQLSGFSILLGAGLIRGLALVQSATLLVILVSSWLLAVRLGMGLYGVGLGWAVPVFLYYFAFRPAYTCRQVGLSTLGYLWRSYARVILVTIPAAGLGCILVWLAYPESLVMIALEGALCMAVFAVPAWWFVLGARDRCQILGLFKRHTGDELA